MSCHVMSRHAEIAAMLMSHMVNEPGAAAAAMLSMLLFVVLCSVLPNTCSAAHYIKNSGNL